VDGARLSKFFGRPEKKTEKGKRQKQRYCCADEWKNENIEIKKREFGKKDE